MPRLGVLPASSPTPSTTGRTDTGSTGVSPLRTPCGEDVPGGACGPHRAGHHRRGRNTRRPSRGGAAHTGPPPPPPRPSRSFDDGAHRDTVATIRPQRSVFSSSSRTNPPQPASEITRADRRFVTIPTTPEILDVDRGSREPGRVP